MKTVTIDELLVWAFVHELPKGGGADGLDSIHSAWRQLEASSWGKVLGFAELMTLVDRDRAEPGMWIEQGAPHEDALEVGKAVADLARFDVSFPEGWNPVADWQDYDGLADDAVARATERLMLRPARSRAAGIASLVISSAVLGRAPDYTAPEPECDIVKRGGQAAWFMHRQTTDAFGREYSVEVDGFNRRARRPYAGAYRKFVLTPDPTADILGRIDYQIWVAALEKLESGLINQLVGHKLTFSHRSATPWMENRDMVGVQLFRAFEGVHRLEPENIC
ncbi:hypothetical protein FHS76_003498 [Ochrobactrum daejeonense]|uniref:Uncharacterized protein n=1 Tax=Brucella daejeonensis TaxID=659015 RepID=A0A7W9EPA3_9HYPH|nr:hypothetical protein [Brucella daejeonensis]MBB5703591.1 hypothetical protein [Brucella daejeonensis]NKB79847.1 hypothetical protein [Brucella daejeonensis]